MAPACKHPIPKHRVRVHPAHKAGHLVCRHPVHGSVSRIPLRARAVNWLITSAGFLAFAPLRAYEKHLFRKFRKIRAHPEKSEKYFRKICLIKVGAMGDVLMTTPFVRALRALFPGACIDYWVGEWSRPVLEDNPHISYLYGFDDRAFFSRSLRDVLKIAKEIRAKRYDLCFVLDHSYLANVFALLCGARLRIGFDKFGGGFSLTHAVTYGRVRHESLYYLDLLRFFSSQGLEEDERHKTDMEIALSEHDRAFARRFLEENMKENLKENLKGDMKKGNSVGTVPIIGIAPGGARNPGQVMEIRRWPRERYRELARHLGMRYPVVLLGGPGDAELVKYILEGAHSGHRKTLPVTSLVISSVGACTLKESAALMERCAVVVCNDSGPMHMAAAVGTPTVSIFGPTDPRRKAPLGGRQRNRHVFLWREDVRCAPCELFGYFPQTTDHACMTGISVADVERAVAASLEREKKSTRLPKSTPA